MEEIICLYKYFDQRVLQNLETNNIKHRKNAGTGLWLGTLVGLCAITTILKEDSSYSEICLIIGVTGCGLVISALCLFFYLSRQTIVAKDFQVIYFLPAIITSILYLQIVNKGLVVSVIWGLSVASLGTWGVVQVLSNFPHCFTVGEAMAVMHGCILFLMSAVTNLPFRYHLPPIHSNDIATVILQMGMLYVLSIYLLCASFVLLRSTKFFYLLIFTILLSVIVPSLHIILDQSPVLWIVLFVFGKTSRIVLIVYWAVCLLLSIAIVTYQVLSSSQGSTVNRKSFHLLAVFVYIPGLIYEPTLLYLASGVIMILFMFLELMRVLKVPPLGDFLQQGFNALCDEKDNLVSLTPLYLLSGLSFPIWMPINNIKLLVSLSGVLTVGIGDTAAGWIGSKWGQHKWHRTNKSIEGTVACILSQFAVICGLLCTGYVSDYWTVVRGIFTVILVSLVEAHTSQIDNLALPLLMYICLGA